MPQCSHCQLDKPAHEFYSTLTSRGGRCCKECHKAHCRQYYAQHKDEIRRKRNKTSRQWGVHTYIESQRFKTPQGREEKRCRLLIRRTFKNKGEKDILAVRLLTGLPAKELYEYLLQTWHQRYNTPYNGELCHIDHIVPLRTANTIPEVYSLFHYSNLQLLTPKDNLLKG